MAERDWIQWKNYGGQFLHILNSYLRSPEENKKGEQKKI